MARFSRFDEMIIGIISGKGEGKKEGRRKFFRYARIFRSSDRSRKCFPLILNSSNDCSKSRRMVAQISPRNSLIIYFTVRDEGDS